MSYSAAAVATTTSESTVSETNNLREFRVASRCELLPYLLSLPIGLSRKHAKDLLRHGAVTVRGKTTVRHDTQLQPDDVVAIRARKPLGDGVLERYRLTILHLDDDVVVLDKPAGLLSMGSEREKERTAHRILNEQLKALTKSPLQQAFIVHRLDRETSGLMVFARSESAQTALQQTWKNARKTYLAVVEGVPSIGQGTLRDRLEETKSLMVHRVDKGGVLAITHYRVICKHRDRSLVELRLETGRKHQIRVQLAALGNPIVGDRKYGARTDPARRLALHSYGLSFRHPASGASMEFHSALPDRLKALIERPQSRARE